jgi:hypothetical protein
MYDIRAGVHRRYAEIGIPVVTAGHAHDRRFLDRFYAILSGTRAVTSDGVGTAMIYALEMGVTAFLLGERATIINEQDKNFPVGIVLPPDQSDAFRNLTEILAFRNYPNIELGRAKNIVNHFLGMADGIAPEEMKRILWSSLVRWCFTPKNVMDATLFILTLGKRRPNRSR